METIRTIYKIGLGPSSSHTIGPNRAASTFVSRHPEADKYRVTLYGSLAATGKGHMTDKAIAKAFGDKPLEIVWRADIVPEFHTNGMLFEALDASGNVTADWTAYSIGGGEISEGPEDKSKAENELYPCNSMTEIRKLIHEEGFSFWEYVEHFEGEQIWDYLATIWEAMKQSIRDGLANDRILPGCLRMRSKAKQYYIKATGYKDSLRTRALVMSYALAVSEQNARGAQVVTAPTCGSCGVLPSVLYHMSTYHDFQDSDILKALATAGLFANVIRTNASVSGAEVGCQGEVGSACVMAAAAVCQLFGGTPMQIECAAEMAMEHNLGLTCDPICGLVQIPCIERNAVAALRALDVSLYSLLNDGSHRITFDKVIDTMKRTGHDIPNPYKETAGGGLATLEYDKSQLSKDID